MQPAAQPFQLCVKLASGTPPGVAVRIQILDRQNAIQNTFNQIIHQSTQFLITYQANAASINVILGNMHEFSWTLAKKGPLYLDLSGSNLRDFAVASFQVVSLS